MVRLTASCRVALAALLHDLGKFAERARIPGAQAIDAEGKNDSRDTAQARYLELWNQLRQRLEAKADAIRGRATNFRRSFCSASMFRSSPTRAVAWVRDRMITDSGWSLV